MTGEVVDTLKRLEHEGYHFEAADASLELLMRAPRAGSRIGSGSSPSRCRCSTARVVDGRGTTPRSTSTPKQPSRSGSATSGSWRIGEGNGPVNALDTALRSALSERYPQLGRIHLTDFKVRVLDTDEGHRCRDPRPARLHRRKPHVDDHRRVARTSSRPPGRRWPTPSSTAFSTAIEAAGNRDGSRGRPNRHENALDGPDPCSDRCPRRLW